MVHGKVVPHVNWGEPEQDFHVIDHSQKITNKIGELTMIR